MTGAERRRQREAQPVSSPLPELQIYSILDARDRFSISSSVANALVLHSEYRFQIQDGNTNPTFTLKDGQLAADTPSLEADKWLIVICGALEQGIISEFLERSPHTRIAISGETFQPGFILLRRQLR